MCVYIYMYRERDIHTYIMCIYIYIYNMRRTGGCVIRLLGVSLAQARITVRLSLSYYY